MKKRESNHGQATEADASPGAYPLNVRFFNRAWESSSVYRLVSFVAAWVTLLSVVSI
jgi:hypothetical protein